MKIAVIGADATMSHILGLSFHFLLAQQLCGKTLTQNSYRDLSAHGDFIMVDNGAAEGELVLNETLIDIAEAVSADEVVLPDVLRDSSGTLSRSTASSILWAIPHTKRVIVPQGRNWSEWIACLENLLSRCNPATIGVAKWLEELPGGRKKALEIIYQRRYHHRCRIHLLGAARDFMTEMRELNFPFVRSMDTALPLAHAQVPEIMMTATQRVSIDWQKPIEGRIAERNIQDAIRISQEVIPCIFR